MERDFSLSGRGYDLVQRIMGTIDSGRYSPPHEWSKLFKMKYV